MKPVEFSRPWIASGEGRKIVAISLIVVITGFALLFALNSTNFPTTLLFLRISVSVSTTSVAVTHCTENNIIFSCGNLFHVCTVYREELTILWDMKPLRLMKPRFMSFIIPVGHCTPELTLEFSNPVQGICDTRKRAEYQDLSPVPFQDIQQWIQRSAIPEA